MNKNSNKRLTFQATEEILRILETSKKKSEKSIDSLPGVFVIATEKGTVLRSNLFFEKNYTLKNSSFSLFDIIDETSSKLIHNLLQSATQNSEKSYDIELNITDINNRKASFYATVIPWSLKDPDRNLNKFFTLIGRDVTEVKDANKKYQQLKTELNSAKQVQEIMLPEQNASINKHQLTCRFMPASECGGDFLYYNAGENNLRIWAGDVTGHGVGPSMISGAIRAAISFQKKETNLTPSHSIENLNECIIDISQNNYWMTFQVVDFDFDKKHLDIASAGHVNVIKLPELSSIHKKTWKDFHFLSTDKSSPLGVNNTIRPSTHQEPLESDTLYICFTDGLNEAKRPDGDMFNYRRIFKSLLESLKQSPNINIALDNLFKDLSIYTEHQPLEDDISLWALKIN